MLLLPLAIKIKFNYHYEQAGTYQNLGNVSAEQQQWEQAVDYFIKSIVIYDEFEDEHHLQIALRSLARIHQKQPQLVAEKLKAQNLGEILAVIENLNNS